MGHGSSDHRSAIVVRGARTNNLKSVDVDIPKDRLVVITGVSGSGKSSLAFDTIAAESQRLLTETYPAFLQSQLPHAARPDARELRNLTATIAVTQSPMSGNPRSTVGTATDASSWLRQLFVADGTPSVASVQALSFNSPHGACSACDGLGQQSEVDADELVHGSLSLNGGAIDFPNFAVGSLFWKVYTRSGHFDNDKPVADFTDAEREMLLYGSGPSVDTGTYPMAYEGVIAKIRRLYLAKPVDTLKPTIREALDRVFAVSECSSCGGTRLNGAARACRIGEHSIATASALPVDELHDWLVAQQVSEGSRSVRDRVVSITRAMHHVGLGYLSLDRPTSTLSGGEAQRIRTVMHLDSALTQLTYVFDEPAAGLHPHDTARVVDLLRQLRDKGNTVLVVEHNLDIVRAADHIIDLGPRAGVHGGRVLFQGTPAQLAGADTPTARSLSDIPRFGAAPRPATGFIPIRNARLHNLRRIDVDVPTGNLVAIAGVAGAGKTSLLRSVPRQEGLILLDQSPIRGSRRSSIATYTGALDDIRAQFAKATGAPVHCFSPHGAGACEECGGYGVVIITTPIGESLSTPCGLCEGRRFTPDTLRHVLRGVSIADVLDFPAEEAARFFSGSRAGQILRRVTDTGIGYVAIGQPLTQLSGGERQRLRLAVELGRNASTYLLDEPTTGLHAADVDKLTMVLRGMVDRGASVIVADHNLRLIAAADHVIELGPYAGSRGGTVCFQGTPEELVAADTLTGRALARAQTAP